VQTVPLSPSTLASLSFTPAIASSMPAFYQGSFLALPAADTFVYLAGWDKGYVWINGYNLGRFWQSQGPQMTLFVPAAVVQEGTNTITILEFNQAPANLTVQLVDQPIYQTV
jgi:beta-galactosidase